VFLNVLCGIYKSAIVG